MSVSIKRLQQNVFKACVYPNANKCTEVIYISCNMGTEDLADMYALGPWAPAVIGLWAYVSANSSMSMLQPLHKHTYRWATTGLVVSHLSVQIKCADMTHYCKLCEK